MTVYHPVVQIGNSQKEVQFEMHTMKWIEESLWEKNAVPHKHNNFVIILVKNGSGVHLVDLDKFDIQGNSVYCLSPGQIHMFKADEGIDGYVVSFTSDFLCLTEENYELVFRSGLFYTFSQSPVLQVTEEMFGELEDVSKKMLKEYENFFLLRSEILRGYLKIFLIYLTRQFEQFKKDSLHYKNYEMVKSFFSRLEKNYTFKRRVSDYAHEFSVTPNYLNVVVKKVTGFPASKHIKQRVILEAKRHAIYADVSMKEIAYSLGFDDTAHFSKYFKNAAGMNFSDFKTTAIKVDS